jgi:hypothetical protein
VVLLDMSNQVYANNTDPYFLSSRGIDKISFNKNSSPPVAYLDKGILYEMNDGNLYFNGVAISAGGDVDGPASSTDSSFALFDSTTGKLLKDSTSTLTDAGVVTLNGELAIHTTGDATDWNVFLYAGNESITGGDDLGIGKDSLKNLTDGWNNTAIGNHAMENAVSPDNCTSIGTYSMYHMVSPQASTAIGNSALYGRNASTSNCCVGNSSGGKSGAAASAGVSNTFFGTSSGYGFSGDRNVYIGSAQGSNVTGDNNIRINGSMHGFATTGSNNIFIGTDGNEFDLTETDTIRIGENGTQGACYLAGVYSNYDAGNTASVPMVVDSDGLLARTTHLILSNKYTISTVSTTPYVVQDTDQYLISTLSSGSSSTITLPPASSGKRIITIIDAGANASANAITVNKTGGDTINGTTGYLINYDWGTVTFVNDGVSAWYAISNRHQ